jgi:DNA-binding NtrC family response regulator
MLDLYIIDNMSHYTRGVQDNIRGNCNIAIIDDERDLLYIYKKALELQGLQVITFDDSLLALDELKSRHKRYCLVIVDVRMPQVNGYQLINEIKNIDPLIKIVLMSASDISELDISGNLNKETYIDGIMHKPFSLIKLVNTVSKILENC